MTARTRVVALSALFALLLTMSLVASSPLATVHGELLSNGDFESGFMNGVGNNWTSFDNDAAASYGFCDDMWAPVVSGGEHSQLIDINTMSWGASDPDRYAGIYQTICWLYPGTIYELSLHGMIRQGDHGWQDADPYRYRVQWGYTIDGSTVWTNVDNWQEIPWDNVYPRTAPGAMMPFSLQFQAPTSKMTLFFRVWKKWGDPEEQVIVNLDEISLRACAPARPSPPAYLGRSVGSMLSKEAILSAPSLLPMERRWRLSSLTTTWPIPT